MKTGKQSQKSGDHQSQQYTDPIQPLCKDAGSNDCDQFPAAARYHPCLKQVLCRVFSIWCSMVFYRSLHKFRPMLPEILRDRLVSTEQQGSFLIQQDCCAQCIAAAPSSASNVAWCRPRIRRFLRVGCEAHITSVVCAHCEDSFCRRFTPTKSFAALLGRYFSLWEMYLENFISRPGVIPAFLSTPLHKQGQELRSEQTAINIHEQWNSLLIFAS